MRLETELSSEIYNQASDDLLIHLLQNDIITIGELRNARNEMELKKILAEHPYSIYKGTDGRWKTYVEDKESSDGRRRIAKSSKEKLYEALRKHYANNNEKSRLEKMTLRELYPLWIEHKRLHTNAETYISRIESDWKKYYLDDDIIDIPIKKMSKLMLDEWIHRLIKRYKLSKNQFYNCTVIIRQSLLYAVDLGVIGSSPMELVKVDGKRLFRKVGKKANKTQVFTKNEQSEIEQLAWEDFRQKTKKYQLSPLALLFQFVTGLRISEVLVVRYEDIEQENYMRIQRMFRRETKEVVEHTKGTYGDRKVVLTSEAKYIIECARQRQEELHTDGGGYIFSDNGFPPSYHSVADLYRKYCDKLGIERKSSHKARKTYISSLIDGNVSINTVREMVGHASERTTFNNYCFDRSTEDEKIACIEKALS